MMDMEETIIMDRKLSNEFLELNDKHIIFFREYCKNDTDLAFCIRKNAIQIYYKKLNLLKLELKKITTCSNVFNTNKSHNIGDISKYKKILESMNYKNIEKLKVDFNSIVRDCKESIDLYIKNVRSYKEYQFQNLLYKKGVNNLQFIDMEDNKRTDSKKIIDRTDMVGIDKEDKSLVYIEVKYNSDACGTVGESEAKNKESKPSIEKHLKSAYEFLPKINLQKEKENIKLLAQLLDLDIKEDYINNIENIKYCIILGYTIENKKEENKIKKIMKKDVIQKTISNINKLKGNFKVEIIYCGLKEDGKNIMDFDVDQNI